MYNKSGVGFTISCKSDGGFTGFLSADICTGWTRRRGLTGGLFSCGGGGTKVGMGVGVLLYNMLSVGCSGKFRLIGGFAFLFLFLGGGEANMSGSTGVNSVNCKSCSSREEGVFSICLDSSSKQISASK